MAQRTTAGPSIAGFGIGFLLALIALVLTVIFWVVGKMTPEEAGVCALLALAILL